jgi:outer membrane protein OmpA-like peptidoglycan-associated protein
MNFRRILGVTLALLMGGLAGSPLWAQPETGPDDIKNFRIRNIGFVVNTGDLEYAPTVSIDGRTLYFVSDRPGGVGGHDFMYTTKADRLDTIFSSPQNLGTPINTPLNEGVASIAADGQTIFFTGCNRDDGLGDCDIYEAELDGTEWKNIRNVSEINSPYWDTQPSISSDGRTLYFVSNRPGSMGGSGDTDIYSTTLGGDGRWTAPKNLGAPINTEKREDSPFILAGSKVLYFSSAGHGGEGGLDFFSSEVADGGAWQAPENLGPPFNTSKDERFITLPAAGDIVYFSSERRDMENAGKLDIFMGLLPPKIINVLVLGRVFDQCTNSSLASNITFTNAATGETIHTAATNTSTGEYNFVVTAGKNPITINVTGQASTGEAVTGTIEIPAAKAYMEIRKDFPLGQMPTITANYEIADYIAGLPESAPAKYRNFRGLLIEENLVKELYPLLTYVFFDSGRAEIPNRYILFKSPEETRNFNDSTIPGGTLQKYYHMLNIVGHRMRSHPETKIEIVGTNSEQPAIGETIDVSKTRGEVVYNYLTQIWQIDPSRIKLLAPRGFPVKRSNPKDPLGIVENRRTEINSSDWEIVKPIVQTELRRYPQPETMTFTVTNGIPDELIATRTIEIKRPAVNGFWHTIDMGKTGQTTPPYNWGRDASDEPSAMPNNEDSYTAQLVVRSPDGKECRSPEIQIPVMIITNERKRTEQLVDKTIDRFSLVLFEFDSPNAGPLNDRIIREFILPSVGQGARINVTGYTDVVGAEDRNLKLSGDRANTVVTAVRKNVRAGVYSSLDGKGVGEASPLYRNDLPEGRFYNRTVQVIIETPTSANN